MVASAGKAVAAELCTGRQYESSLARAMAEGSLASKCFQTAPEHSSRSAANPDDRTTGDDFCVKPEGRLGGWPRVLRHQHFLQRPTSWVCSDFQRVGEELASALASVSGKKQRRNTRSLGPSRPMKDGAVGLSPGSVCLRLRPCPR